jgi:uncharacterized protein (TIGR02246 family)
MTLEDEVAALSEHMARALANQDVKSVMEVFAEDALCVFPDVPLLRGRAAIEQFFQRMTSRGPTSLRWQAERLIEGHGVVIEIGREWFQAAGETVERPTKYVGVFRREDGVLKVLVDAVVPDVDEAGYERLAEQLARDAAGA